MDARTDPPYASSLIDLAWEPDFVLGPSRVSPSTREVLRGTERELLEPRVMQVLVALFRANGRVVSRDELIARCWEGRIVGEDAINRAISRLRRLSEVDHEASFKIETIPRVGYRIIPAGPQASVEPAVSAPAMAETPAPARQNILIRHRLVIAAAIVIIAAATVAGLLWPERKWAVESSRPFVSTLALEDFPAFSPDGKMLAYTSGINAQPRKIYVRNLAGGDGLKITGDDYDDVSPSWSSDGARIAYIAQKPGEPCRILIVDVPDGRSREAARCTHAEITTVCWRPNSETLYYVDLTAQGDGALMRLDLDSGTSHVILLGGLRNIAPPKALQCSPDGKWLLYEDFTSYLTWGIAILDLDRGNKKVLGRLANDFYVGWLADSRTVLASVTSYNGSEIVAYPIAGGKPYRVYTTAANTGRLSAGAGGRLALETDVSRFNLAYARSEPGSQPDIADQSNGMTWSPTFAPDGTLAFLSNRSGNNAIWVRKPGKAPVILLDCGQQRVTEVRWSPDGSKLALVLKAQDGVTVRVLTADAATLTSFNMPSIGLGMPTWSPDGKALLAFDRMKLRAYRIPLANPSRRDPIAAKMWDGITIRSQGIFAIRSDMPGIWDISTHPRLLNGKYPVRYVPALAFRGDDILVPEYGVDDVPRIRAQPLAGGPDRVIAYAPGAGNHLGVFQSDFAVDPRNGDILYVAAVAHDTNIDLLTLVKR